MIKVNAYIHGQDTDNISFINIIILEDVKTISVFEFKTDNCIINVYDNTRLEIVNIILYQIFGKYIRINSKEHEIKGNFIPIILNYINNQNVACNFMKLGEDKGYAKKITRR